MPYQVIQNRLLDQGEFARNGRFDDVQLLYQFVQVEKHVLQGLVDSLVSRGTFGKGAIVFALAQLCLLPQLIEQAATACRFVRRGRRHWDRAGGCRLSGLHGGCRTSRGNLRKDKHRIGHAGTGVGQIFPTGPTLCCIEVEIFDIGQQRGFQLSNVLERTVLSIALGADRFDNGRKWTGFFRFAH